MMTSILSPVGRDYAIAIIQDMEMVRGEAHGTDCLGLGLDSKVCSERPVNRIQSWKLSMKDEALHEGCSRMSEASPGAGVY